MSIHDIDVEEGMKDIAQLVAFADLINSFAKKRDAEGNLVFTIPKAVANSREFKDICFEAGRGHFLNTFKEMQKEVRIFLLKWAKAKLDQEIESLRK